MTHEQRVYDPQTLYVWCTEKSKQCLFCGLFTPYYTTVAGVEYVGREVLDRRCLGLWHAPVVSRPEHFTREIIGLLPVEVGVTLDQCVNLSAAIDRQTPIRWEEVLQDGRTVQADPDALVQRLQQADVEVSMKEARR